MLRDVSGRWAEVKKSTIDLFAYTLYLSTLWREVVICLSKIVLTIVCVPLLIPNRTSLLRFGGISGEFGRAMVRIWARRSRAKIPIARPKEPDMSPKRTKNVRLGIYRTQIHPKIQHSGQWLDIVGYQDSRIGSWLANCEFGYGKTKKLLSTQASNTSIWYS